MCFPRKSGFLGWHTVENKPPVLTGDVLPCLASTTKGDWRLPAITKRRYQTQSCEDDLLYAHREVFF